jgi:hypothetical protein
MTTRSCLLAVLSLSSCTPPPAGPDEPVATEADPDPAGGEYTDETDLGEGGEPPAGAGEAGGYRLEVLRVFDIFAGNLPKGAGGVHGDYVAYGPCGTLMISKPSSAVFIICNGAVAAGPLTDVDQVKQANDWLYQQASALIQQNVDMSAAGQQLAKGVRDSWPCGGACQTKVYDSTGNLVNTY